MRGEVNEQFGKFRFKLCRAWFLRNTDNRQEAAQEVRRIAGYDTG